MPGLNRYRCCRPVPRRRVAGEMAVRPNDADSAPAAEDVTTTSRRADDSIAELQAPAHRSTQCPASSTGATTITPSPQHLASMSSVPSAGRAPGDPRPTDRCWRREKHGKRPQNSWSGHDFKLCIEHQFDTLVSCSASCLRSVSVRPMPSSTNGFGPTNWPPVSSPPNGPPWLPSPSTVVRYRDEHRSMAGYLRATLGVATATTTRDRKLARLLSDHPVVGDALLAGHISIDHALQIERIGANPRIGHLLATVVGVFVDEAEHTEYREFAGQIDEFIQARRPRRSLRRSRRRHRGSPGRRVRCRRHAARVGVRRRPTRRGPHGGGVRVVRRGRVPSRRRSPPRRTRRRGRGAAAPPHRRPTQLRRAQGDLRRRCRVTRGTRTARTDRRSS